MALGAAGARVVVNDFNGGAADAVVKEIVGAGGVAMADHHSVSGEADKIVAGIIERFGRIDAVINNAGILRDKSFIKMTDAEWDAVQATHLQGTYSVTKAAWPHMLRQKSGRY